MTEEQRGTGPGLVKYETLPAEMRAKMLESQQSLFLNVAKFEQAQRVAQMLAASDFVPKRFQGKVGNCLIALDLAETLNCKPILLMQSMYIVHEEPAFKGSFVAAMINASGRYDKLRYRFDGEGDKYGCTAHAKDRKTGEVVEGPKVTWEIVKAEGWLSKNGSKWKTMPELMFSYRAAAWFGRRHDPDILMGMQTVEEAQDIIDITPDRTGRYTADDITEKLKANATEDRAPATHKAWFDPNHPANAGMKKEESAVPGEQPTVKAETPKKEDISGAEAKTTTQGPQPSAWDPYKTKIQQRYPADKAAIIKTECETRGIMITGLVPREAHGLLLDSVKAEMEEMKAEQEAPEPEETNPDDEIHTEDCRCPTCCAENPQAAAHKKMLDEKEARRKALYGDKPREDHEVIKTDGDFDENAPQKMAGDPAPASKADLRDRYIVILEQVGKIDRIVWMKSKQQVGLLSSPNVHTMPLEKLIEWATLAQSMTEGKKDIQFS